MNNLKLILLLFLTVSISSCQKDDDVQILPADCIDSSKIDPNAICNYLYKPVCGCNDITYSNICHAEAAGVTSYTAGPCGADDCIDQALIAEGHAVDCTEQYEPVCGCDGNTYANECIARFQHGIKYTTPGSCGGSITCIDSNLIKQAPLVLCPEIYDPVCGCNGVTYHNECLATYVGGVTSYTYGPCSSNTNCIDSSYLDFDIACTMDYNPVCGCDGITYSNACVAKFMHGVTHSTPGPCANNNCIEKWITDFGTEEYSCARIDKYNYHNKTVYLLDPGNSCIGDAGYTVLDDQCNMICYFGGFNMNPQGHLCNGDDFFQIAEFISNVWKS